MQLRILMDVYLMLDVKLSKNVGALGNQDARYSSFGSPISIEENNMMMRFVYNENNDRVKMEVLHDGTAVSTKYYMGDCYELEQKGSDVTERLYLGGDYYSAPMVRVKTGSTIQFCNILRDNLGSITHVTDYNGNVLQELSYDAWGRLRNPADNKVYALGEEPALYLGRGYTGHEHLAEFGLINMNARLYDPMVGRFLSPDPYVQMPEQSQNFNRYSYCMNNPLKYTDKNGKFFLFTPFNALVDCMANVINHGFNVSQYNWTRTINSWNIDKGMFKGNFGQVLNKWTFGIVNSFVGNFVANAANYAGMVHDVTYMDGMAAISGVTHGNSAVTIGHYSMGPKKYKADWRDNLFVHEYGHYIQSQYMGIAYFPVVAIPSLFSAAFTSKWSGMEHSDRWFEQNASTLGAKHFDKKYGSGADGYKEDDSNYFQMSVFRGDNRKSPYVNPRLGYKGQDKYFPKTDFKLVAWDFVYFMLPRFLAIY